MGHDASSLRSLEGGGGVGWDRCNSCRQKGVRGPSGGGGGCAGGCVPKSVWQALHPEHFLSKTLLLPCAHRPRASALATFCVWETVPQWRDLIVFLMHFKEPRRNTQFLQQIESERA